MNPRARERDGLWSTCALLASRKSPRPREKERDTPTLEKENLNPAYLGPPRRFGAHFISFQIPKSYAIITQRVIALLSQSVLLSRVVLLPMRGGAPRTQERERKERENLTKRIRLLFWWSLFFFLNFFKFFPSFLRSVFFSRHFSLSLSLALSSERDKSNGIKNVEHQHHHRGRRRGRRGGRQKAPATGGGTPTKRRLQRRDREGYASSVRDDRRGGRARLCRDDAEHRRAGNGTTIGDVIHHHHHHSAPRLLEECSSCSPRARLFFLLSRVTR